MEKKTILTRRKFTRLGLSSFGVMSFGFSSCSISPHLAKRSDVISSNGVSFALISDTHLGAHPNYESNLILAIEQINLERDINFIICTGDLIDQNFISDDLYRRWSVLVSGKPVYAVPGNHDRDELFEKYISEKTSYTKDIGGLRLVGLNNAIKYPAHRGEFRREHRLILDEAFEGDSGGPRNVVIFSHVINRKNNAPDRGWFVGSHELTSYLEKFSKRILFCVHGHYHCGLRGWSSNLGLHEIVLPALSFNEETETGRADVAGGFNPREFGPSWVKADIIEEEVVLSVVPVVGNIKASNKVRLSI